MSASLRRSLCLLSLSSLLSAAAWAQETDAAPTADIEQVWLDPSARGSLWVGNGQTLRALDFRVGASLFFTQGNLRSASAQTSQALVANRLGIQVVGALGLTDWLELSANVPVIVYQDGSSALGLGTAGMGNPWLNVKVAVLGESRPVAMAVGLGLGLPLGTAVAQGNGGLEVAPKVQVGKVFSAWQWGAELGFLYRPTVDFISVTGSLGDRVGSQVWLAGMLGTVNTSGPRGELALRAYAPLTGGPIGLETQVGVRWTVGDVELYGSAGPGFFGDPTTPSVRAYFGAAFANTPLTQPPCVEGREYRLEECPELDRDGDGVKNGVDAELLAAEDKDGFADDDGAPDPDNDGDGVKDADDFCPLKQGPAANRGCPDGDADGDGVVDRVDRCPAEKEDVDGFEDGDGCLDADNDADAIPDAQDACPEKAGIAQEKGCPAKDSDGDAVMDHEDNCPQDKGEKPNAGCPAAQKQLVVLTASALALLEKVSFDAGKATVQRRSLPVLDNVARVLVAHPEISKVRIEAHTDGAGPPDKAQALSAQRADAVKKYLVEKGVADARLEAAGLGNSKPVQAGDSPSAREANQRVEFVLGAK
ncbi:MAG: OmpA family protein [Myxococcota bacterium]